MVQYREMSRVLFFSVVVFTLQVGSPPLLLVLHNFFFLLNREVATRSRSPHFYNPSTHTYSQGLAACCHQGLRATLMLPKHDALIH